ncbi:MAG: hypothetical protein V7K67_09670 [Nostoc sp.]
MSIEIVTKHYLNLLTNSQDVNGDKFSLTNHGFEVSRWNALE